LYANPLHSAEPSLDEIMRILESEHEPMAL